MTSHQHKARLMIASSEQDADMYYATRFFVPDAFVFVEIGKKSFALMNDLEVDRAKKEANVSEVLSYSKWAQCARALLGKPAKLIDTVAFFLKSNHVTRVSVPQQFPVAYADALRIRGLHLEVFNRAQGSS